MTTKRKTFTKAFKQEAVRLLEQGNQSAADIARELGIKRNQLYNQLYKWQEQIKAQGKDVFPGSGRQSGKVAELNRQQRKGVRPLYAAAFTLLVTNAYDNNYCLSPTPFI